MPIRPDLRQYYKPPAWAAVRRRILERAGGKFAPDPWEDEHRDKSAKVLVDGRWVRPGAYLGGARCEQCKVPDWQRVDRALAGSWRSMLGGGWRNCFGERIKMLTGHYHVARIVLTVAHLNHTPGDDRDENLKALCQWCHLHYDAEHHAETRKKRKDKGRPLLG